MHQIFNNKRTLSFPLSPIIIHDNNTQDTVFLGNITDSGTWHLLVGVNGERAGTRLAVPWGPTWRCPIEARQALLTVIPCGVVCTPLGQRHEKIRQFRLPYRISESGTNKLAFTLERKMSKAMFWNSHQTRKKEESHLLSDRQFQVFN